MKTLTLVSFIACGQILAAQTAADYDARLNPIQSYQRNNPAYLNQSAQSESQTVEIARSDMGIQRPIDAKKTGFGYHLGFSSRLYYSDNPGSANDGRLIDGGGVWDNTLNNTFILGSYDLGGSSLTPILGLSYLKNSNFGTKIHDQYDFDMLNLNFAGVFQIGRSWSVRPNLSYSHFFGGDGFDIFSPSLSLGKSFNILSARSFLDWSLGFSLQDIDLNNNFQSAWSWGVIIPVGGLEISPHIRFAYLDYYNDGRTDFKTTLAIDLNYALTGWLDISFYLSYTNNNSDNPRKDFSRFDTGAGTSFTARF